MFFRRKRSAFSLLEMLAVVTILGIIAAVVLSRFTTTSDVAKDKLNEHTKSVINSMVERYYLEVGSWPSADLNELNDANYFPDGIPVSPWDASEAYTVNASHRAVDPTSKPAG